ncbi:MAG: type VI secretion system tip protein VgrG [Polyangiaceae bacterium]|nr:type VI secretion system tip protein VgrG [Polyangiaceae bacterium]
MDSFALRRASASFSLDADVVPGGALEVLEVTGHEGISTLFEIVVTIVTDEPLGSHSLLGERAALVLRSGENERPLRGIIRAFEQGDARDARLTYRVTLAPSAYVLALREDCRVFQGRRAPEIIESVLTAAGFTSKDYRIALRESYRPRDYRMQYRESDWTFLRRLMEVEGIYTFFDQDGDREVLVFADAPSAHATSDGPEELFFHGDDRAIGDREVVTRFRHVEEIQPGRVALRGYDFRNPKAALERQDGFKESSLAIHDAPPEYETPEDGERLARLRLDQEASARGVANGASNAASLRPGAVFELSRHASDALNRGWLVTTIEHHLVEETEGYQNRFTAVAADVAFRTRPITPKPAVGIQTATVVGPVGQEVHCDELGRVKIRFNWDREGQEEERSSWVRASQPWAGPGTGVTFIPRIGDQVLVDFAGGDCDRPIIVGSVHDGVNKPPLSLPFERTAAVIRATSSPGGDGYSELRFDADAGREHVLLRSSRDLSLEVMQDKTEHVVRDETLDVGGGSKRSIAGDETISIRGARRVGSASHEQKVGGDASTAIGGAEKREVRGQKTEIVGESLRVHIGSDETRDVAGASQVTVKGPMTVQAEHYGLDVREDFLTVVEADHIERAERRRIRAGELVELVCGDAMITAKADDLEFDGERVTVEATRELVLRCGKASITLTRSGKIILRGTHVVSRSTGTNKVLGTTVRIN